MPTYEYACTACQHQFEQVQSFSDDALTVCPECGGQLRKVFGSVGLVFKGSGFYKTDSRSATSKSEPASSSASSDSGSSSSTSSDSSSASKDNSPSSSTTTTSTPSTAAAS